MFAAYVHTDLRMSVTVLRAQKKSRKSSKIVSLCGLWTEKYSFCFEAYCFHLINNRISLSRRNACATKTKRCIIITEFNEQECFFTAHVGLPLSFAGGKNVL